MLLSLFSSSLRCQASLDISNLWAHTSKCTPVHHQESERGSRAPTHGPPSRTPAFLLPFVHWASSRTASLLSSRHARTRALLMDLEFICLRALESLGQCGREGRWDSCLLVSSITYGPDVLFQTKRNYYNTVNRSGRTRTNNFYGHGWKCSMGIRWALRHQVSPRERGESRARSLVCMLI